MRPVPAALQAKLDSGVTTLCRCWILTRGDGVVQGFTDHDRDVTLDGVLCRAGTGLTGSEATQQLGLAVTGAEISGALAGDCLTESDLAAGRYDAARVDMFVVDWSEPALLLLAARGTLGEIRREGAAFTAEFRGLADRLSQESGRLYTAACATDLGDGHCKIDLSDPRFSGGGNVVALAGISIFTASGLDAFEEGWFSGGRLVWTSGANQPLAVEIKRHRFEQGATLIELWHAMPEPIAPGDAFAIRAGCDKRFVTCRDRFDNVVNFRGFPHIPGNDFVMRYAVSGEPGNDGKSLQS